VSAQIQNGAPAGDSLPGEAASGPPGAPRTGLDDWLRARLDLIALLVVAVGFVLRLMTAAAGFLNPDEALHYLLANQPSVISAYRASLSSAHPPFFLLLIYFVRYLGNSELTLRLPFVLMGAALPWVAYKWLRNVFGHTAALIGLLLLALSPAMIWLSAEVRGYAALLLFMASALYFLDRAFDGGSAGNMAFYALFLYGTISTEYSGLWVALTLGIYALMRIIRGQLPASLVKLWVASQVGATALFAFLYVTHISTLKGGGMEREAITGWLRNSYFQSGRDSLLLFPLTRSAAVFEYLFSQRIAGIPLLLVFLGGVAFLLAKGAPGEPHRPNRRELGILLLLPFVFGCGAAILGIYPYGGTRHSAYLVVFAVAGISFMIERLAGGRIWPVLLVAAIVMPVWHLTATPPPQFIDPHNQSQALMSKAVKYIRRSIPPGALLLVDHQTSQMLGYYLGKDQVIPFNEPQPRQDFLEYPYGGYRVVSSKQWDFNAASFKNELGRMREAYGVKPGETVWVVDAGWGVNLYAELAWWFPQLSLPGRMFGAHIAVFQAPLAQHI